MTNIEEDYLNKDFDYTKLTMVKLKKLLFENGILDFPSNLKKQQLLEIYKENIHDKIDEIKKKRKKDMTRDKNKYQSDRSSIIDLEASDNDQVGGVFTNGRTRRASAQGLDVEETPKKSSTKNKQEEKRPRTVSPEKIEKQHVSFLDSIGTYLKNSANREIPKKLERNQSPFKDSVSPAKEKTPFKDKSSPGKNKTPTKDKDTTPTKKQPTPAKEDIKKVYIDVDTSDFSNTSFFSYQSNKADTPKGKSKKSTEKVEEKRTFILPIVGILILVVSYVVSKTLPYCSSGDFFCINVPENGKVVDGKLVCQKGYFLKRSFLRDLCLKDDTKEVQMAKTIRTFIKKLEIMKGNYIYGFARDYKIKIEHLTNDEELIKLLKLTPGIIIEDGEIYSSNYRTTLRVFLKFYSTRAFYFLIPLLFIILIVHFYIKRRHLRIERRASCRKIVKEIQNVLLRQLIMSTKNTRFPSYVYVEQLRDVFVVDSSVWKMVKKEIESNSNIRKEIIEEKEIWEWIGPLMHSVDNLETLVA